MRKLIGLLIMFISIASPLKAAETITVVTENQKPYSYEEDGQVKGVATAVVQAVIQKVGIDAKIEVYPWARAYDMALKDVNVLIYPMVKTSERTPLFKWVGEIAPVTVYLVKLKSRTDIQLTTLDDVKPFLVGGVRGWASTTYLPKNGIRIEEVNVSEQNVKKLQSGRIDLLSSPEFTFLEDIKQLGYPMSDFEFVYELKELSRDLQMAFSQQTPDDLVERFRKALETIKTDGTYDTIYREYFVK